jgi:hypothetical protein
MDSDAALRFPCGTSGSTEPMHGIGDLARCLGGDETSFTGDLLRLIAKAQATRDNYDALRRGFPRIVRAWELWMVTWPTPTGDQILALLAEFDAREAHTADLIAAGLAIRCPECRMVSQNPNDVRKGYCGNCRAWTTPRPPR